MDRNLYDSGDVPMIDIFEYLEYQSFLRDHYEWCKKSLRYFSFRYIALKTGLDASFYVKVLNKQKHISDGSLPSLITFLKLNKKEAEYFTTLVHFNKAKEPDQERLYFEKLLALRNPVSKTLEKEKYDYFSCWHNVAVWEELKVITFKGDFADLAARIIPTITPAQAKNSVLLLEKLGMIQKNGDGAYRVTDQFVSSDGVTRVMAVRAFQKEVSMLAAEAIERIPKEDRDISTLTLSTTADCLEAIRERLAEVRQEIMKMVKEFDGAEEVYQLNFQIFPLTVNKKMEGR
jgi:uncharacterized protein (TIGR02147 family)